MAATRALLFLALAAGDPSPTVRPTIKATPRPVAAPTTARPTVKATPRPVAAPTTTARPTITARPTVKATPRPVAPPTSPKPTVKASPRPSAPPTTPRPTTKETAKPTAKEPATARPTPRPAATPKPTIKETARPTPRPQQTAKPTVKTPGPTLLPTAHFDGVHQTDSTIRPAVKLWLEDNEAALHKYGKIEDWDVSQVTDLSYLFCVRQKEMEGDKHYKHCVLPDADDAREFNYDLSKWDTSRVTSMRGTFSFAQGFNQPIGKWRTSSVTDMDEMFSGKVSDQEATGFNQPIEHRDVSHVKTMERMFKDAAVRPRRLVV